MRLDVQELDFTPGGRGEGEERDLVPAVVERPDARTLPVRPEGGRVEFRNVSFRYPGASENALNGISFVLEPGERVMAIARMIGVPRTLASRPTRAR